MYSIAVKEKSCQGVTALLLHIVHLGSISGGDTVQDKQIYSLQKVTGFLEYSCVLTSRLRCHSRWELSRLRQASDQNLLVAEIGRSR